MTPDEIQKMVNDYLAIETPGLLAIDSINLKDLVERLSGFYLAGYAWGKKKASLRATAGSEAISEIASLPPVARNDMR